MPGTYTVRLEAAGRTLTRLFSVVKDPRSEAWDADLDEQLDLLLRLRDRISETNDAVGRSAPGEAAGSGVGGPGRWSAWRPRA